MIHIGTTILTYCCVLFTSANNHLALSFTTTPSTAAYRTRRGPRDGGHHHCTSPHPSYCSYSTALRSTDQQQQQQETTPTIIIERPVIHWTVPIQKIGWQDEETGKWYDEDGLRKGPPQNYWRQKLDQRAYDQDMDLLTKTIDHHNPDGVTRVDAALDAAIRDVEGKNSVRYPSRNRNLLGKWAPVYLAGAKVATPSPAPPVEDGGGVAIAVPLTVEIFRAAGRKLAPKNHYGVFDASLVEGEEVTVRTGDGGVEVTVGASVENLPLIMGSTVVGGVDRVVQFGGVTYVSDYLLVQRDRDGGVSDIWLRIDDAYLGKNT